MTSTPTDTRTVFDMLADTIVYPASTAAGRTATTVGAVLAALIHEAQQRGALPGVSCSFNETVDSAGAPWPESPASIESLFGQTYVEAFTRLGADNHVWLKLDDHLLFIHAYSRSESADAAAEHAVRYSEAFYSQIVDPDLLDNATSRHTVHLVTTAMRSELVELIAKLRRDHLEDLNEQVGYGGVQALERAVYHLESAASLTAPVAAAAPVEQAKPVEWHLFEHRGARKVSVSNWGNDRDGAVQEAARLNSTAFGMSYSVESVELG